MTGVEANKIIAEFMGVEIMYCEYAGRYYTPTWENESFTRIAHKEYINFNTSIDAILPVWDKLMLDHDIFLNKLQPNLNFVQLYKRVSNKYQDHKDFKFWENTGKTIQEAAAIATAKAIQELGKL